MGNGSSSDEEYIGSGDENARSHIQSARRRDGAGTERQHRCCSVVMTGYCWPDGSNLRACVGSKAPAVWVHLAAGISVCAGIVEALAAVRVHVAAFISPGVQEADRVREAVAQPSPDPGEDAGLRRQGRGCGGSLSGARQEKEEQGRQRKGAVKRSGHREASLSGGPRHRPPWPGSEPPGREWHRTLLRT